MTSTTATAIATRPPRADAYRPPLTWTATEYAPRHRRWWFVVITLVGLYLAAFLLLAGNWTASALALTCTIALVVLGLDRPRQWHYTLDDETLTVEGRTRSRPILLEWKLVDFSAVTTERIERRNQEPYELLVLLGRHWLSWPKDVYLTGTPPQDRRIVTRLTKHLPDGDSTQFQISSRTLQRLARWLRIA